MRLYSILIYNLSDLKLLYKNFNLSDFYFYTHFKIKAAIIEIADQIIKNLDSKKFYQITEIVNEITFQIYIYTFNNNIYIYLTDEEYPIDVIFECVGELDNIYKEEQVQIQQVGSIWLKYQDPTQISKILKVKKELTETKKVLLESIDKVLERGEKIEDLIAKTEQLETSSRTFKIKATKLNSCCTIL